MPVSEKKKLSNQKWDRENMTSMSIRLRKEYAAKVKAAAARAGSTPGTIMRKAIDDFMKDQDNTIE